MSQKSSVQPIACKLAGRDQAVSTLHQVIAAWATPGAGRRQVGKDFDCRPGPRYSRA